ncbi:cell wall-binding repeat-containing protein [Halobacillus sp. Nhm2S1]|uniref:cell wall-binding repeat-containing protein n=1 Tax=Halobacillus sp. Nhm2S1 TaxID=2866716 RepID=UPI001C735C54|nr:cell wall-binding repeat-containing protein [Halobacillus sp. Nhm2S1]MBX0357758.1 cell wall-binding repeat-containing protein [Halobacillus sp. Nhm2S1]
MLRKLITSTSVLLATSLLLPAAISAEQSESWVVEESNESIQLNETMDVNVVRNELETTIQIEQNGQTVIEETEQLAEVTDVHYVGEESLVVVYRAGGSASSLYFDVYDITQAGIEKVYESQSYDRATIDLNDNQLEISYPEYDQDDVSTEPSAMLNDVYTIGAGEVAKKEEQEKLSAQSTVTTQSTTEVDEKYENPSYAEINRMLTEEAKNFDIPPEIVKAIAFQESGWQQYWGPDRTPVEHYENQCTEEKTRGMAWDGTNLKLGYDCIGIGIMQVSDYRFITDDQKRQEEITKLATDIRYNIREGLKILETKWNYADHDLIPTVNSGDRDAIENWYFAILAYNGLSQRNDPIANGYIAYQEKIFSRIKSYGLLNLTPFPTHKLNPDSDGLLSFGVDNVDTEGPVHASKHYFRPGEKVYVTAGSLNLRQSPNGLVLTGLSQGDAVTITDVPVGSDSNTQHWMWYPVETAGGVKGYVASSYLSNKQEPNAYRLSGINRYETSAALSNFGWHWNNPDVAVIGRGDLPIDSLTGSVLASYYDAPLLLTQTDQLPETVNKELKRMGPSKIYLLGSEAAVSSTVETQLKNEYGDGNVVRLSGKTRFETAYEVADELSSNINVDEIFITTSDETSPDALSIASYAGQENTPILLTLPYRLEDQIVKFIEEHGVEKATIIGGTGAVHNKVEEQLKSVVSQVERVSGDDRYSTSVEIADRYFNDRRIEDVFFARGQVIVDALAASPMAASYESPIILTRTDNVPSSVRKYIQGLPISPKQYYLGGDAAISDDTAYELLKIR